MLRLAAAIAAACLLFAGTAQSFASYKVVNDLATWIAGRDVEVHCLTPQEAANDPAILFGATAYVDGLEDHKGVWHPGDYTVFNTGICEILVDLATEASFDTIEDQAWAVLVITHESGHLKGHWWAGYENLTETWALRHVRYTAWRLGVDEPHATDILREAIRHHNSLPEEYRAPGCSRPSMNEGKLVGCLWRPER